jgi:hypothetical protein
LAIGYQDIGYDRGKSHVPAGGHMKKRYLAALFAAVVSVSGGQGIAHHSFSATYHEDQSVTIEGELVQFLFRNPHSFVHILVKQPDGSEVRYSAEWGGAGQLQGQGVTRDTLKSGDFVVVSGAPGRNPADHRIRMVTLRRPSDNFGWGQRPDEKVD